VLVDPSPGPTDAPCPRCGNLLWFPAAARVLWPPEADAVIYSPVTQRSFDTELWKTGSLRLRGSMTKDLVASNALVGASLETVLQLLGEPDEKTERSWGFAVWLNGRVRFHGIPHRLRVTFGGDSRVVAAAVVEDVRA
jgi:hypothetical protein